MIRGIACLAVLLSFCTGTARTTSPDTSWADAVLIVKSDYDPDSSALLMTERSAIAELAALVANNPHRFEHACGYHWQIVFRDRTGQARSYFHNKDCEIYRKRNRRVHSVLRRYFDQVKNQPSHFVFNVSVPASLSPEAIMARSSDREEEVFFLRGEEERLPRLVMEVTSVSSIPEDRREWNRATDANLRSAMTRMAGVVAAIRQTSPSIRTDDFRNGKSMFGGGEIEHSVQATVYYAPGVTISADLPRDVRVLEKVQPATWTIQVVSRNPDPRSLKRALEKKLGVEVAVAPYPETAQSTSSRPSASPVPIR